MMMTAIKNEFIAASSQARTQMYRAPMGQFPTRNEINIGPKPLRFWGFSHSERSRTAGVVALATAAWSTCEVVTMNARGTTESIRRLE
jgi:hypothetical protein